MKLWDKNISTEKRILAFTTGKDSLYDLDLAPYDILGSIAHAIMLKKSGLLSVSEARKLIEHLTVLYDLALSDQISLEEGVEDIHSQVEIMLTRDLGDLGKKIHTGRSRNDQVMLDIKLFLREELQDIARQAHTLAQVLLQQAEKYREVLMPGYTHMQVAMPSSFALWFGAYAEALADDLVFLRGIHALVNQNPLGSAAGFGSSFPVNRELTTDLLAFENPHISSVNAQMNRGKTEWYVASGIAALASTLARFSMDAVLFIGQNFNFITLPGELTTGSSIMPHKKNPDVLELLRARLNRLNQLPAEISAITTNLISGYHRDFQELKEIIHPALNQLKTCLDMMTYVVERIEVNPRILENDTYIFLYSVEEVNRKVQQGIPFRDAYKEVAAEIDKGRYRPGRDHIYTHLGSIGNPGMKEIEKKLTDAISGFRFVDSQGIFKSLTQYLDTT